MLPLLPLAHAQDVPRFDGQLFRPSPDAASTLWVEDSHAAPDGYATARAYLQYAHAPVRWDGTPLVRDLVGLDVLGAYSWRGLRLAVDVPVYLYAGGALSPDQPGLGDLALDLKGTLLDRTTAPVGLALVGRLALPTASVEVPLGANAMGWELFAVVDDRVGDLLVAGNVGTRGVPRATYEDLVWNDQVFGRLGAGYALVDDGGASLELAAQTNWASGRNPAGTAAELLAGGWWGDLPFADDLVARGGVSVGLSRSPGAPVARLVLGVSWEPDPYPDRDLDGIVDRADDCPSDPEDPDGFEDDDGCHDRSTTGRILLVGPEGAPVDGAVVLEGPDAFVLAPGDPYVTLHPGPYHVTADASGFVPWSGDIEVPAEQGFTLELPLVAEIGTLLVWAVDPDGRPLAAQVTISGGAPLAADGTPIPLGAGEHAVFVTAPGHVAEAIPVKVAHGERRELPVVLERASDDDGAARADARVGLR